MHCLKGKCHCGNIRIDIELSKAPAEYAPRACDCEFCRKHGASYISDPHGSLRIEVMDSQRLGRYRQGSETAECLICTGCGVLVGVTYRDGERLYATINSRAIDNDIGFGEALSVSPKVLSADEKIRRWKALWFSNVTFVANDA
ncbi:MAG: aldehyde-activating protein [Rhodocyclales bacterium]|nr:aldehyde-activating protein [Rhodocyclales bacterium]